MLGKNPIIAFVPTANTAKARAFYEKTLGLKFVSEDQFALVMEANGIMVRIANTPGLKPVPHTILGWHVPDIRSTVSGLRERGVEFARYDFLKQDELGIWSAPGGASVAWFKDADGNLLSLTQF